MKKVLVSVLAAAAAAAAVSAVSVSAAPLGFSGEGLSEKEEVFFLQDTGFTTVTVDADTSPDKELPVTAEVPAGALTGSMSNGYIFHAELVEDDAAEAAFAAGLDEEGFMVNACKSFDIFFVDDAGQIVLPTEKIKLTFKVEGGYNVTYIREQDDSYTKLADSISGVDVPHFSRFVIAEIAPKQISEEGSKSDTDSEPEIISDDSNPEPIAPPPSQTSTQPSQTSIQPGGQDVKTGDNAGATAMVFAVMAAAALGTSIAAVKSKKSSR